MSETRYAPTQGYSTIQTQDRPPAMPAKRVPAGINSLSSETGRLHQLISQLEESLSSVLGDARPSNAREEVTNRNGNLAGSIECEVKVISCAGDRLAQLIERLEL